MEAVVGPCTLVAVVGTLLDCIHEEVVGTSFELAVVLIGVERLVVLELVVLVAEVVAGRVEQPVVWQDLILVELLVEKVGLVEQVR